jgi:hypothetical protein
MAISLGFKTTSNQNPAGNSQTLALTCSNGTDKGLFVAITMPNTVDFSSASYDGVGMTLVANRNYSGLQQRQAFFYLYNPSSGSAKNLVINFSGNQWSNTSILAQSFTGVDSTIGITSNSGASTSPNSKTLNVAAGSLIYASGISINAQSFDYTIGGINRTPAFNAHNTNRIVEGAFSALLAVGTTTIITRTDTGTVSNNRVEIKAAASSTPTLSVTPTSLSGFTYEVGQGASQELTFVVEGSDLTGSTTITPDSNYEVSLTSGSNFIPSINVGQTGGAITNQPLTIYVRLKGGLSVGLYSGVFVNISSSGAANKTVALAGEVTSVKRNRIRLV